MLRPQRTRAGFVRRRFPIPAIVCALTFAGCTSAPPTDPQPTPTPSPTPTPAPTPTPNPDDSPDTTAKPLLPTETPRVAYQSPCAQAVFACSGAEPVPSIEVVPQEGQFVTVGELNIVLTGQSEDGVETVQFSGSGSTPGTGAIEITYSWSYGANDGDPNSFTPGTEFSTEAEPVVRMGEGFHYIRLIVRNGTEPALENWSPTDTANDFLELEIEVRITTSEFFAHTK